MKLIAKEQGYWELEGDPTTFISRDDTFETWCDEPHPVRMRADAPHAEFMVKQAGGEGWGVKKTTKRTKQGWVDYFSWHCPGNQEHFYTQWTVQVHGEWTEDVYDTFAQARQVLEQAIGKVTLQRRQAEPDPVVVEDFREMTEQEILEDELRGLNRNIESFDRLLQTEDAPYADLKLLDWQKSRKAELEKQLERN